MLPILDPLSVNQPFPNTDSALKEPDGLLAMGGCLSPDRLANAYRHGIFPWFSEGQPILWWSPDPRLVLFPERLTVSRSLRKVLRKKQWIITCDKDFSQVIKSCAAPRPNAEGTWITPAMDAAYRQLHQRGIAHSVEAWYEEKLVGGLYGVALGRVFFGESMFSFKDNASKAAFATLVDNLKRWGYKLIDCQVHTEHLVKFGAENIPRSQFVRLLNRYCGDSPETSAWPTENLCYNYLPSEA